MNGDAGWHPSLVAIGWSFVFDSLDYGRLWGQRPGVVGHTCRSAVLVLLLFGTHAPLPVWLTGVRVGCGPPWTRWLTSVVPAPGRVDGG